MKKSILPKMLILPAFLFFMSTTIITSAKVRGIASWGNWQLKKVKVHGVVSDQSGNPLPGVTIVEKGTQNGTTSDNKGGYIITVNDNATLIFTTLGMEKQEIKVNGREKINVILKGSITRLNEVVAVGYTTQSKRDVTASVATLGPGQMKNTSNPNPLQALQGKIAGLSLPIQSGQPGAGANNIIIRGGTGLNEYGTGNGNGGGQPYGKINSSTPLVIVDGVFRNINDINPDDIASVQVMKDAASTAIYGARGANGVIVITTKTGEFNTKPTVTLNYRHTWETRARKYDYLNATQYLALARTTVENTSDPLPKKNLLYNGGFSAGTTVYSNLSQFENSIYLTALYDNIVSIGGQGYVNNLLKQGWQVMDDPINHGTKLLYKDNNYQNLIWKTGQSDNYNLGVSGGSATADYHVSLGYEHQEGVYIGTDYTRYSALGNFNFRVSDNFKLHAMVNYSNELPNYVNAYQNELTRGTRLTPLIRLFYPNGDPTMGEVTSAPNRLHTVRYDHTHVSTEILASRVEGDLTIVKGLHYRPAISYLINDYSYIFHRDAFPGNVQFSAQRQKTEETENSRQLMIDQIFQYDYSLNNDHHFSVLAGFNYTRNSDFDVNIGSKNAVNDYIVTIDEPPIGTLNGQTISNVTGFNSSLGETISASYFGQLNYNFKNKYLFSAAIRDDGFSNFAPENKYALFPSVSAGWNIAQESFWKIKAISSLKLRGSWGTAGSSDLTLADTYGDYLSTVYAQNPGILRANLANPNLRWEKTETTDIGLDAGFLQDRITLTVDFYNKLTEDRLATKPLPHEAPFTTIPFNNGTIQNKGIEVELGGTPLSIGKFSWRANFTFAYNHQLIVKLPFDGQPQNRQGGTLVYDPKLGKDVMEGGFAEGERPFGIWGYKVVGVFPTDSAAAVWNKTEVDEKASPLGIKVGKHAGDFQFADLNHDGVIDTKDEVFLGYATPDITGGMQNTFSYGRFTLRFNVDYATGFIIENGALARSLGQGRAFNEGAPAEALGNDIWQKSGDVGKKYARFSFADYDYGQRNYLRTSPIGTNNGYGSDVSAMVSKGNFLAFREVYLSYEFPEARLKKIHVSGLNIYGSVYNIGYLTAYKGLNPETYTGFDDGGYPRPRQFTLGASLKF